MSPAGVLTALSFSFKYTRFTFRDPTRTLVQFPRRLSNRICSRMLQSVSHVRHAIMLVYAQFRLLPLVHTTICLHLDIGEQICGGVNVVAGSNGLLLLIALGGRR
jgi:hypothetical protein